jgi:hypothetical protein
MSRSKAASPPTTSSTGSAFGCRRSSRSSIASPSSTRAPASGGTHWAIRCALRVIRYGLLTTRRRSSPALPAGGRRGRSGNTRIEATSRAFGVGLTSTDLTACGPNCKRSPRASPCWANAGTSYRAAQSCRYGPYVATEDFGRRRPDRPKHGQLAAGGSRPIRVPDHGARNAASETSSTAQLRGRPASAAHKRPWPPRQMTGVLIGAARSRRPPRSSSRGMPTPREHRERLAHDLANNGGRPASRLAQLNTHDRSGPPSPPPCRRRAASAEGSRCVGSGSRDAKRGSDRLWWPGVATRSAGSPEIAFRVLGSP